jgi:hypothetical protein
MESAEERFMELRERLLTLPESISRSAVGHDGSSHGHTTSKIIGAVPHARWRPGNDQDPAAPPQRPTLDRRLASC